jgi:hypothetical protein
VLFFHAMIKQPYVLESNRGLRRQHFKNLHFVWGKFVRLAET